LRLLVFPHDLAIGGSQINAIDLAASVAAVGHEVLIYGVPGPLVDYIAQKGLRFVPAHPLKYRPAPTRVAQLAALARSEKIDLIHAYEWSTCLEAYCGAGLVAGIPLLCTVLSMQVMPYVPTSVPLIMGTAALGEEARKTHKNDVWVLEPPIDVERDNPAVDGRTFRQKHGIGDDEILIVSVSRLALDLKLDALVRAIDACGELAQRYPVRLIVVGDGPAAAALAERANAINLRAGRTVVSLPGSDQDPRPAYAAADIVVGMGSSALRAMAIGRPVVVQGEQGFSDVFEPQTYEMFLHQGFYGLADGVPGVARLAGQLEALVADPGRRQSLGRFGCEVVNSRFSLQRATEVQLEIYRQILARRSRRGLKEAMRSVGYALQLEIANHDPRRKRRIETRRRQLLLAAQSGAWPPEG
jgi:glycosyltransferase involved in cell wall biosynthesis